MCFDSGPSVVNPAEQESVKHPTGCEKLFRLKTGETFLLRPIRESDGGLLADLFSKLSAESIHLRFHSFMRSLSDSLLFQFTHIDFVKNYALVATVGEEFFECAIGVGRYMLCSENQMPELAFVVRDDWQGKGLGWILFKNIVAAARKNRFEHFQAMLESRNTAMGRIFAKSKLPHTIRNRQGVSYYEFDLSKISSKRMMQ